MFTRAGVLPSDRAGGRRARGLLARGRALGRRAGAAAARRAARALRAHVRRARAAAARAHVLPGLRRLLHTGDNIIVALSKEQLSLAAT